VRVVHESATSAHSRGESAPRCAGGAQSVRSGRPVVHGAHDRRRPKPPSGVRIGHPDGV